MVPRKTLRLYRKKRDFHKTPEPTGGKPSKGKDPSFVIQKHAASHLHYDFRLEADGVLKSWAVPKGPSTDPQVKRLAVQVEDHPLDYAGFEGVIPQGQYGGGNVIVWDRGSYRNITTHNGRPLTFDQAMERGHLRIWMEGEKLRGGYALTRTKLGAKPSWLLVKINDELAHQPDNPVEKLPKSVISGRRVEEIGGGDRVWQSNRPPKKTYLPAAPASSQPPPAVVPMLATLVEEPFTRPGWFYEPKLDGERCIAFKQGKDVGLFSRTQKILADTYPELTRALKAQRSDSFIVDGEIVTFEPGTEISSFHRLQQRMHLKEAAEVKRSPVKVFYYLFDILYAGGRDVRKLPLSERKKLLEKTIRLSDPVRINRYNDVNGEAAYREACRKGLEGVIAKKIDSTYQSGRSRDWLKFKCVNEQEFLIVGYTDPQGTRDVLGALLLGYYDHGKLRFAGKVGTGFDVPTLRMLAKKLHGSELPKPLFPSTSIPPRGVHWVDPRRVVQIAFSDWTPDGKLRHPRYLGLRDDKAPGEVTRERKTPAPSKSQADIPAPVPSGKAKTKEPPTELRVGDKMLTLSNLKKVMYPSTGFTKGEMLNYYIQVAPYMLPYLKGRPLTMKRYPDGVEGFFFYEKQAPSYRPSWLKTFAVKDVKTTEYPVIERLPDFIWIANLACIEFHTLLAKIPRIEQPTMIALDLDPGPPLDSLACAGVAMNLRDVLNNLKLKSFLKTSGSKGLHLYIPLNTKTSYEATKAFAHSLALYMESRYPKEIVSSMKKTLRQGKVLIDWSQNSSHKTTVTAYSLRARPTPSVSTPISWEELQTALKKKKPSLLSFTPAQTLERLKKQGDLFAPVLTLKQKIPPLKGLSQ